MKITSSVKMSLLALALTAGLAATSFADKEKEKSKESAVAWNDVPAAVQATIKRNAGGGTVAEVEKKTKKGADVYTATITGADGKSTEVKVAADGTLLKTGPADNNQDEEKGKQGGKNDDKDDDDKDEKK